jgi:hypothetical protein
METDETDGSDATGQAYTLHDLCDGADIRVLPVVPWNEQNALFLAHLDGDRDIHVREDDGVVKRD